MSGKESLWQEIGSDLKEKTKSGYKMALLDSDKLLRIALKEKGYPGKSLKKQLFWSGINLGSRPDLKNAIKKKEEILNEQGYRLSTFEIEDFLDAYKKATEKVLESKKVGLKRKIGIYLENYLFLKNVSKSRALIVILAVFFGIKLLSSTDMGNEITSKIVDADNFIFDWFKLLFVVVLVVTMVVFISFIYLDKKKKVRIKD